MAYRYGERDQASLFPKTLDECVADDAPVRAYDAFVQALNIKSLDIVYDPDRVGNSAYDPKAMLKLLVYGYSYGIRGSRKLEQACYDNIPFIWIMHGLKPDHKTISEFRRKNRKAIAKVIKQCARMCIDLDLINGNVLFVDGSKLRANAAIKNSWTKEKAQKAIEQIDERIERLLDECEATDYEEKDMSSLAKMKEELKDERVLKERINGILEKLSQNEKPSLNTTDKDSVRIHSRQGSHAGYNAQIVVDDKNGLIVNSDVVDTNNDLGHFSSQIKQAQEVVDGACETAVADSGYADYEDISNIDTKKMDIIMPTIYQAGGRDPNPFEKSQFKYDSQNDCYICPEKKPLRYASFEKSRKRRYYLGWENCLKCKHFGICTTNKKHGRKLTRNEHEDTRVRLENRYKEPDAKKIFARRKAKAEHPFGHIKRNLGFGHFLLRGLEGVRAEWSLITSAFNLTRMISILGVKRFMTMLMLTG